MCASASYTGHVRQAAPTELPPLWRLIAVLASTIPLERAVALWLYQTAVEMRALGQKSVPLAGDLGDGRLTDMRQEALIGSIGGPAFEAILETNRGKGHIKFIVTKEGLEAGEA